MTRFLQNILDGARQTLVLAPDVDYERPARGGFSQDQAAMRGDAVKVARDMTSVVKRHGPQIDNR
jgi:hypothetical protein